MQQSTGCSHARWPCDCFVLWHSNRNKEAMALPTAVQVYNSNGNVAVRGGNSFILQRKKQFFHLAKV